jgi:hypothetical protein
MASKRSTKQSRIAAAADHTVIVQALLADSRARADPTTELGIRLRCAAYWGDAVVVQALLTDGRADPATQQSSALRYAARNGHTDIVRALLADRRSDPVKWLCVHTGLHGGNALWWAADNGHTDVVQAVLDDGRVDLRVCPVYRDFVRGMDRARADDAVVLQPVRQVLERWTRWQQRRPWLRACQ